MTHAPEEHDELKGLDGLWESALAHGRAPLSAALLRFVRNFPTIAAYNAAMIGIQRPGSRYVLTARQWRDRFGRQVVPGANPLVILKPFGPVEFVYDVSDVEGDPLPAEVLDPFASSGPVTDEGLTRFALGLPVSGIAYAESQQGPTAAGHIVRLSEPRKKRMGNAEKVILFDLVVNRSLDANAKFATVAHELGHLYCGHLGELTRDASTEDDRAGKGRAVVIKDRSSLPHEVQEFEAEAVSWLVCGRIGVTSPAGEYLGNLLAGSEPPPVSFEAILSAVRRVESLGHGTAQLGVTLRDDRPALFAPHAFGQHSAGQHSAGQRAAPDTALPRWQSFTAAALQDNHPTVDVSRSRGRTQTR
ncbi:hypothetical protein [Tomitella gaofuii]|uniref:hypothetical protein n=1 Tax=Tomitella gaofuii TaxID=2760083 RepID=UPI0015FC06F6|nr:hypothetical protein [Tomitella gaofuii]